MGGTPSMLVLREREFGVRTLLERNMALYYSGFNIAGRSLGCFRAYVSWFYSRQPRSVNRRCKSWELCSLASGTLSINLNRLPHKFRKTPATDKSAGTPSEEGLHSLRNTTPRRRTEPMN